MRRSDLIGACAVLALATAPAWGQYGLYGSPQVLDLSRVQSGASYGSPAGQPAAPAPYGSSWAAPASPAPWGTISALPPVASQGRVPARTVAETPPAPQPLPDPAAGSGPSLVDQMLEESTTYGNCGPCGAGLPAPCGDVPVPGYATSGLGGSAPPAAGSAWYAYGAGLVMGRNEANRLWTTYEPAAPENQLMHTQDIGMPWQGGWEGGLGWIFGCGQWALEGRYWGLASVEGSQSSRDIFAGLVSTPLIVGNIQFGTDPGDPGTTIYGTDLFDNAEVHILERRNEVHNVELNLIRNRLDGGCDSFGANWSLGVRYFRFEEALAFRTLAGGYTWADDNGAWSAVLSDRVQNNLIGMQLGCDLNWDLGLNLNLFVTPAVGIYGNQIDHDFQLYRGDGVVAVPDPSTGVTQTYPVHDSDTVLSFLSQMDLGVSWLLDPHWEAFIGYRVVFATGIALADHQIPTYVVDIPEIAAIDDNGDLVYHGAFVGLVCRF